MRNNRIRIDETAVQITNPANDIENFFVNIDLPIDQSPAVEQQLAYEATVGGEGIDVSKIDRVDMFVVASNGTIVNVHSESNPPYCGFGDGLNNACQVWSFSENQSKWPSGVPIQLAQYIVRVIVYGSVDWRARCTFADISNRQCQVNQKKRVRDSIELRHSNVERSSILRHTCCVRREDKKRSITLRFSFRKPEQNQIVPFRRWRLGTAACLKDTGELDPAPRHQCRGRSFSD